MLGMRVTVPFLFLYLLLMGENSSLNTLRITFFTDGVMAEYGGFAVGEALKFPDFTGLYDFCDTVADAVVDACIPFHATACRKQYGNASMVERCRTMFFECCLMRTIPPIGASMLR